MSVNVEHPSVSDRRARGEEAGSRTPPSSHAGWEPATIHYWRQLRDMKGSAVVEAMSPSALGAYARNCGWTLARAHARSGDPIAITEYLGDSDEFDRAITDFSKRYADQNERDYQEFVHAVRSGRLEALEGV